MVAWRQVSPRPSLTTLWNPTHTHTHTYTYTHIPHHILEYNVGFEPLARGGAGNKRWSVIKRPEMGGIGRRHVEGFCVCLAKQHTASGGGCMAHLPLSFLFGFTSQRPSPYPQPPPPSTHKKHQHSHITMKCQNPRNLLLGAFTFTTRISFHLVSCARSLRNKSQR